MSQGLQRSRLVDFKRISGVALDHAEAVVVGLLPTGRREWPHWVALNPRRADRGLGSFKINLRTGVWKDFASGDGGADLIALAAFVTGLPMREAAVRLAESLGMDPYQ